MVNADNILKAFETHQVTDIDSVDELIQTYPYFQAAWALKTLYLKQNNTYHKNSLQQTAARSIDRSVLFEFINREIRKEPVKEIQLATKKESESVKPADEKLILQEKQTLEVAEKQKPKKKKIRLTPPKKEKYSYIEWLQQLKQPKKQVQNKNIDLIEKFLKERPKIVPVKDKTVKPPKIIEQSVVEKQMLMTETLANLYVKQKKYDKAIQAFRILSLKYPKKSSYFANQIKEIKKLK